MLHHDHHRHGDEAVRSTTGSHDPNTHHWQGSNWRLSPRGATQRRRSACRYPIGPLKRHLVCLLRLASRNVVVEMLPPEQHNSAVTLTIGIPLHHWHGKYVCMQVTQSWLDHTNTCAYVHAMHIHYIRCNGGAMYIHYIRYNRVRQQ